VATETKIPEGTALAVEGANLCWSCNVALAANAHFCPACGKVQPPGLVDYFSFFRLPRKLNIDTAGLEREFYRLSRKLHPDVYAQSTGIEQAWSLEKSSQLNDAYRTLKDPIARTQYVLQLEGVKLEEQSSAATLAARESGAAEKKQVIPPELLEEVFELNMQLQEMKMGRDEETVRQLAAAKSKFEAMLGTLLQELHALWNEWDAIVAKPSHSESERIAVRDKMVDLLNRRSYVRNLVRDVNEALSG
jgi:molecular chaperone HscB